MKQFLEVVSHWLVVVVIGAALITLGFEHSRMQNDRALQLFDAGLPVPPVHDGGIGPAPGPADAAMSFDAALVRDASAPPLTDAGPPVPARDAGLKRGPRRDAGRP